MKAGQDQLAKNEAEQVALDQKITEATKEKATAEASKTVIDFSQDYSDILRIRNSLARNMWYNHFQKICTMCSEY